MKRRITMSISVETLRKLKILASKRGQSMSQFLVEQIDAILEERADYEEAESAALAFLERGFHLGGGTYAGKDELHRRSDLG